MIRRTAPLFFLAVASLGLWLIQPAGAQNQEKLQLNLDVLYDPDAKVDFDGSPPRIIEWLKDGEHYVELKPGDEKQAKQLLRVNARTGESQPLFDAAKIQEAFAAIEGISQEAAEKLVRNGDFKFSPDEAAVMITHQGDLFHFRFADDRALQLTSTDEEEQEPDFSPDGRLIAFIRSHDLHVVDVETSSEKKLTSGGSEELLNGILDWVYQEEIYGRGNFKGYWWSPDSKRIAFIQLDESPVPSFTIVDEIPVDLKLEVTRYPQAGDPNPNPKLGVVDAAGGPVQWIDLSQYKPEDLLIVKVGWTPDGSQVVFQTQNKEQTWLDLNFASWETGKGRLVFRETTPAWVSVHGDPEWLKDGSFLWLSERTGWNHIYRYGNDGALIAPVTKGEWEVRQLHGLDEPNGWIYFTGTERSPIGTDVYRVKLDGGHLTRISEPPGTHRARFNRQFSLFIDSWSDIKNPTQTRLFDSTGKLERVIHDNPAETLAKYALSEPEFLQVKTRDGFVMEAMLIKPAGFDPQKKYPVMSFAYSGPHAPQVNNRWGGTNYLWHQMLAQRGYVIWVCDNRTASGKGAVSAWPVHRNMGELELKDLEDGLSWLKSQPWVDGARIGLWGWSYGGYMTSYALTHSQSFKIGIAGAPVTDWHLYDTVYTERYMGTPQSNPEGYERSSVLKAAANLHGKLLLVHGTIDDNVHPQNSIKLAYELQKSGKQFQLMLYPKSRHRVADAHLAKHLRVLMTQFIEDNL